jgi:hypothetical protein
MGILLGFAPFIVFALVANVSISLGLWLAFAAAFVVTIRDFVESPTLRLLDAASVALFGVLALIIGFVMPGITLQVTRLVVELAYLLLALTSFLVSKPLTLEYGHEHVPDEVWNTPVFRRANYLLTGTWAAGFAVMAVSDAAVAIDGSMPLALDLAIGLGVLGIVIVLTVRYPAGLAARKAGARRGS